MKYEIYENLFCLQFHECLSFDTSGFKKIHEVSNIILTLLQYLFLSLESDFLSLWVINVELVTQK